MTTPHQQQLADLRRLWPLKLATAVYLVAMLVGYSLLAVGTWSNDWPADAFALGERSEKIWMFCFAAGGIGSTLYTIRGFYHAVGPQNPDIPQYQYDPNWTFWYFFRPLIGGIMGIVGYVTSRLTLTPVDVPEVESASSALSYMAVAFLGGFGASELLEWLRDRARSTFRGDTEPKPAPGPDPDEPEATTAGTGAAASPLATPALVTTTPVTTTPTPSTPHRPAPGDDA